MQATAGGLGVDMPARRAFARRTRCGALGRNVGIAMNSTRSGTWIARSVRAAIILVVLVSATGCQRSPHGEPIAPEWAPFVEMARGAACSDVRNRLFVIDHVLVFADRAGSCPDASYSQGLFGRTVDEVLCVNHDSIAGPVKHCGEPSYKALFEIITTHLDEPDLGLGPSHTVQQLRL